jgi:hypothetical protein
MLVRIIQSDGTLKHCPSCNYSGFRKSTRSKKLTSFTEEDAKKYLISSETGKWLLYYELLICDNCGHRETRNEQKVYSTIIKA